MKRVAPGQKHSIDSAAQLCSQLPRGCAGEWRDANFGDPSLLLVCIRSRG